MSDTQKRDSRSVFSSKIKNNPVSIRTHLMNKPVKVPENTLIKCVTSEILKFPIRNKFRPPRANVACL